jgi:exodeoxyribonuclease VII small subunit
MDKEKQTFEQAILRIDDIVKTLEKGDAPLELSLSLFEEGTRLIKFCAKLLDTAEQKVVRLQKGSDGAPEELPFEADE